MTNTIAQELCDELNTGVEDKHWVIREMSYEFLSCLNETNDATYIELADGSVLGSLRDEYFVLDDASQLSVHLEDNNAT